MDRRVSIPKKGVIPFELVNWSKFVLIKQGCFNPQERGNTVRTDEITVYFGEFRNVSIPKKGVIPFEQNIETLVLWQKVSFNPQERGNTVRTHGVYLCPLMPCKVSIPKKGVIPFERLRLR